jgi:hypothetical protein
MNTTGQRIAILMDPSDPQNAQIFSDGSMVEVLLVNADDTDFMQEITVTMDKKRVDEYFENHFG